MAPPGPGGWSSPDQPRRSGGSKAPLLVFLGLVVVGLVVGGIFLLTGGGSDGDADGDPEEVLRAVAAAISNDDCDQLESLTTGQAALDVVDCDELEGFSATIEDSEIVSEDDDVALVAYTVRFEGLGGAETDDDVARLVREDGRWLVAQLSGATGDADLPDLDDIELPDIDIDAPDISVPPPPDIDGDPPNVGDARLGPPTAPPVGDNPTHQNMAQACNDGIMAACDDLYWDTPLNSTHEDYGATCGGRLAEWDAGNCEERFGGQVSP